jgi:hypothetical protein
MKRGGEASVNECPANSYQFLSKNRINFAIKASKSTYIVALVIHAKVGSSSERRVKYLSQAR